MATTTEMMAVLNTANYWLFIPTVFCEGAGNLDVIREALHTQLGYGK
jgi:altronate hydrolase